MQLLESPFDTATSVLLSRSAIQVRLLLDELEGLLVRSDTRVLDLAAEHEPDLAATFGADGLHLVRLVEKFEFEAALETLRRLRG